uniref:Uncharacterized protein n=1 Tax=Knipowitschia caucasica TaxID=637954 RepID=A0AAV2J9F9_KNICA
MGWCKQGPLIVSCGCTLLRYVINYPPPIPGKESSSSQVNLQSNKARVQKLVKVFSIISARSYGADRQILDQLTAQGITPTDDPHQSDVILLFCPILTRTASDLDAAVRNIPDGAKDKPVVLVLMHHTFDPNEVLDRTRWSKQHPCLKEEVRVLFHRNGLLQCDRNKEAVRTLKTLCDQYATPEVIVTEVCSGVRRHARPGVKAVYVSGYAVKVTVGWAGQVPTDGPG